jgi:hypothetical protein
MIYVFAPDGGILSTHPTPADQLHLYLGPDA